MDYNLLLNPGMSAFYAGQTRAEDRAKALENIFSSQVNTAKTLQSIFHAEDTHPLNLEEARLRNEGLRLGNRRTEGVISAEEDKRRREAVDTFFNTLFNFRDPELAAKVSGVPEKFVKNYLQLTPEQQEALHNAWIERSQRPDREMKKFTTGLETGKALAVENKRTERENKKQMEITQRQIRLKLMDLQAKKELAEQIALRSQNQNYQQYITYLLKRIGQVERLPENSPADADAKHYELQQLTEELNRIIHISIQDREAAARVNQEGKPNINQLSGGKIPTNPPTTPTVPESLGKYQGQPQQKQETIILDGKEYIVLGREEKGRLKVKDPNTGQTFIAVKEK